jgi:hypothetical protein
MNTMNNPSLRDNINEVFPYHDLSCYIFLSIKASKFEFVLIKEDTNCIK